MSRLNLSFVIVVGLFAALLMAPHGAWSAETTSAPATVDGETISGLAKNLNDEQKAALVNLLKTLSVDEATAAAAVKTPPDSWQVISGAFEAFGDQLVANLHNLPAMVVGAVSGVFGVFAERGASGTMRLLAFFALVIGIGLIANFLVVRLGAPWRQRFKDARRDTVLQQVMALAVRLFLELSGLVAFLIAALITARIAVTDPADRTLIVSFILTAVLITRLAGVVLRFVLGPNQPDLRLVATDDGTARTLYYGLVGLALVIGVSFFVVGLMGPETSPESRAFRFWIGFLFVAWILVMTWRSRAGLTEIIKGDDDQLTPGLERMAAWWPVVSMIIVALTWLFIQFVLSTGAFTISAAQGAIAIALVVLTPFLDTALRGIVKHLVPPMEGEGEVAETAYHQTRNSYVRIGRVVMFALVIIIIGRVLGISYRGLAEASLGAQIAANGVQFLLVIAGGYLAWELVNLWVNRRLARERGAAVGADAHGAGDGEQLGGASQSRLVSVLPLIYMAVQVAIVVLTVLLALSQLGFNIAPLLAGAGVIGLAVGFGAQTLVKDVVSGIFFLLDDAFRLGEFIDVGGTLGVVEKISVRSLQLRDANGPIHIVPYGDISKLTNHSRDWVIMKLKFTVPFDTDLEKVRKLFKKIGQELAENPEIAENMLAPFKSQGVADVNDVGIVIRGKFTAKPGTQFTIRKEIYTRVQKAFDENGIQFARKEVRVRLSDDDDDVQNLTPDQKQAIAAAAVDAADDAKR